MATIKISRAKNASAALNYGKGKNQLKEKDKQWLRDHGVSETVLKNLNDRAVISDGLNVINGYEKAEMKQSRDLFKNSGSTEAMRFIQSFSDSELDASKPSDWKKANQMGLELAEKIAPDNQFAIYTHIDGEGHKLHNHLVMNMPDLKTGKKYNHDNDWKRVTDLSDEVIKNHGLNPLDPTKTKQAEKKSMAERQLRLKNKYVWKDDLRERLSSILLDDEVKDINDYKNSLKDHNISYKSRGKGGTYSFKHKNEKGEIVTHKVREANLGEEYRLSEVENELNNQRINDSESRIESEERDIDPIIERARSTGNQANKELELANEAIEESEPVIEISRSSGERADKAANECKEEFGQTVPLFEKLKTGIITSIRDFADWSIRKARELRERREQAKRDTRQADIEHEEQFEKENKAFFSQFEDKQEERDQFSEDFADFFSQFEKKNESNRESENHLNAPENEQSEDFEGPEF